MADEDFGEDLASLSSDALAKTGPELFRELLRVYTMADVEDYCKNGVWQDAQMKVDMQLIEAHRKEAGSEDPPPIDEVVLPEDAMPQKPAGVGLPLGYPGAGLLGARPPGTLVLGRPAGAALPAAQLMALTRARAAQGQGVALAATRPGAGLLAVAPARPGLGPAVRLGAAGGAGAALALRTSENPAAVELRHIALFVAKWKLDPTRTKAVLAKLAPDRRRHVIQSFKSTTPGPAATGLFEAYVRQCEQRGWAGLTTGTSTLSPGVTRMVPMHPGTPPGTPRPGLVVPQLSRAPLGVAAGVKRPLVAAPGAYDPNKRPRIGPMGVSASAGARPGAGFAVAPRPVPGAGLAARVGAPRQFGPGSALVAARPRALVPRPATPVQARMAAMRPGVPALRHSASAPALRPATPRPVIPRQAGMRPPTLVRPGGPGAVKLGDTIRNLLAR